MIVLGLDLQPTRLGWCCLESGPAPACLGAGVYLLGVESRYSAVRGRNIVTAVPALRVAQARQYLRALIARYGPTHLAYEIVRRHLGAQAAHGWGAQEAAVLEVWCLQQRDILEVGLDPGHLSTPLQIEVAAGKIALTGKGRAEKAAMAAAAESLWPGWPWDAEDSDAADAAGVALAAILAAKKEQNG